MRLLYDLPPDQQQRLAEVLADPRRRPDRVHIPVPYEPISASCGTRGGYERHRRRKEPTCEACRAAERAAKKRARV